MAWSDRAPAPHELLDDGFAPEPCDVAIIGCGNILRGDDAVGPILIRQLYTSGMPDGVRLVDGGTSGMDVAFAMRGAASVVIVDAAATGAEPGTIFRVPADQVQNPPPMEGLHSHNFRWDHALSLGTWLLGPQLPKEITVLLIEGESYEPGAPLSPRVEAALPKVTALLADYLPATGSEEVTVTVTPEGYLHLPADLAARRFGADVLLATFDGARLELMPVASVANGGLVLKQRNAAGDRSVLLSEVLGFADVAGSFAASWDDERGVLVVDMHGGSDDQRGRDRGGSRARAVGGLPAGDDTGGNRAATDGYLSHEGAGRARGADGAHDSGPAPSAAGGER